LDKVIILDMDRCLLDYNIQNGEHLMFC
jgi:hypothetical protein